MLWLTQKRGKKPIKGHFQVELILVPPDKRWRDTDNLSKAPLDWCQRIGIIENDRLSKQTLIRFGEASEAPTGFRIKIKALDKVS